MIYHNEVFSWLWFRKVKGSSEASYFIIENNVGKRRIRHRTTLKLNLLSTRNRLKISSFKLRVVLCRTRLFPTLISKLKWFESEILKQDRSLFTVNYFALISLALGPSAFTAAIFQRLDFESQERKCLHDSFKNFIMISLVIVSSNSKTARRNLLIGRTSGCFDDWSLRKCFKLIVFQVQLLKTGLFPVHRSS